MPTFEHDVFRSRTNKSIIRDPRNVNVYMYTYKCTCGRSFRGNDDHPTWRNVLAHIEGA